jgi:hypothetical protein
MTKPRDVTLPGLEDRTIAELETLAADYADIRDRRIALNKEEGDLKARVMAEMRRQQKETYKRDGIEIRIVHGDDDVKVKVAKEGGTVADDDDVDTDDDDVDTPTRKPAPPPPPMFDDPRDIPPAPVEEPPRGSDEQG